MKKEKISEAELKVQLEAMELKKDEEFRKKFNDLCTEYKRDFTFVYESGVVGRPLAGKFMIVRK